ncbi:c-type cytochrome [Ketogulonicigenium vulgare]|uniref:Cytochrome c551 n=1 Tax=Ketogulonicigenium vulgare (strain WSH-001) TaxID=759362 RepID=F9Y5Q5_KETVW|nr:cytochrome c [Ketogulonicigenium vulgare]ADO43712.1 cytochrome c551 [Ketogulonicigenium vulgare Y25]AEM41980.1 cytochrome c551 [Ketogulonicigenium vulgare WSH-001]ALJ82077.1 cytochrome C551 [Ketogulonicigenium vulgare]ANW34701.1 cytochrome C551 [Ketogulonicigenium vulgare]AOZ55745.1 cytochrome C551 [Ketogulonicigenium vulgare]
MKNKTTLGGALALAALLAGTTGALAFSNIERPAPAADTAATEEAPAAAAGAATSIYDGVYTAAQAEAGQAAWMTSCASCHGPTARGSSGGPRVIGPVINNKYADKPLLDYFNYTRDNMPMGAPHSLSDDTYVEIVAFILQSHGAEPGETELTSDEALLGSLMMGRNPN